MSEEARNTGRHSHWSSDQKFRHSHVPFISAGTCLAEDLNPILQKSETSGEVTDKRFEGISEPTKAWKDPSTAYTPTPDTQMLNMTLNDVRPVFDPQVCSGEELASISKQSNIGRGFKNAKSSNEIPFIEVLDKWMHTGLMAPSMKRSPSPTGTDSSTEVIVFAGRRQSCNEGGQKHISDTRLRDSDAQDASKPSRFLSSPANIIKNSLNVKAQRIQVSSKQRLSRSSPPLPKRTLSHLGCHSRVTENRYRRTRRRRPPSRGLKDEWSLNDYVAYVHSADGLQAIANATLKQCDLGGGAADTADTAECQDQVESPHMERAERDSWTNSDVWGSADLEDYDEISTSNEILDGIDKVLPKRERLSGVQYLITGAGSTIDDARWLPVGLLNRQGAESLVQKPGKPGTLDHFLDSSNASGARLALDEQVAQDLQEDLDDKEGERVKARMIDEQLARLLSKQEELGLGSDDLTLLDGGDVGTDSQEESRLDVPWERAVNYRVPTQWNETNHARTNSTSATAFAQTLDQDPYHGFDIMDRHRPSLQTKIKGRRGKLPMELSDSELEQSMYTAWEKDRHNKRKQKQVREELRAQGLLGKKNKLDLKAKYPDGISMTEVKKEIRDFLQSSMERCILPALLSNTNSHGKIAYLFHRWLGQNAN